MSFRPKVNKLLARAEANRRERPGVNAYPLVAQPGGPEDYGASGAALAAALQHLDESIPSGQRARTAAALEAAELALKELALWLRLKEYL